MSPGKLAAQAGHAYLAAYLANPLPNYHSNETPGTKVCLESPNLHHLMGIKVQLDALSIPNSLIIDSEHVLLPHFTGEPTITALGLGPITKDQLPNIITKLKLV